LREERGEWRVESGERRDSSRPPKPLPAGRGWGWVYPMQDAVPRVVVMAVRMVMMILMTVRHVSFDDSLLIVSEV
jgi:hypothetical protein